MQNWMKIGQFPKGLMPMHIQFCFADPTENPHKIAWVKTSRYLVCKSRMLILVLQPQIGSSEEIIRCINLCRRSEGAD